MSQNTKKILFGSMGLIILAVLGYYFLIKSSTPVTDLVISPDGEIVGQDILILVDKLEAISIDSAFLTEGLFVNLKDLATPLTPEAQGRSSPFATIGGESNTSPPPPPAPR